MRCDMGKQYCLYLLKEEKEREEKECDSLDWLRDIQRRYHKYIDDAMRNSHCPKIEENPCKDCPFPIRY